MTSLLAEQVKAILEHAVGEPNGPVGIVYGAVDRQGKILVAEAAGKRSLDNDTPVGPCVPCIDPLSI